MYKKIDLKNNVRLVLNHMPKMESASIGIWVATGSRDEDKELSGISHFLEHMIFKGTPSRSTRDIKEEIEGRGGSLNGFTSEELTCYLAKVSHEHVGIAIDVLSDMALYASINSKEVEKERNVIIEEIKMYEDLPNHLVHDVLHEMMWPEHALGRNIAGDIKTVSRIGRKELVSYKRSAYIPKNMAVVICGNLKTGKIIKKVKKIFDSRDSLKPKDIIEFKNNQSEAKIRIFNKDTAQSRLSMGIHAFGKLHKDRYALSLLHIILGANMSSRLFDNLREKRGLAYEIGTEIKKYKDTGAFVVNAGMEHAKVKEGVSLILKELKKIKNHPVPKNELKRAKEFFKVQVLLALEDTMDHMLWLGEKTMTQDKLPNKNRLIKKITSLTSGDLQRVARDVFKKENLNIAIVGPMKDKEKDSIESSIDL
ncbi:MAG: pitrilysin family protein [Candidatus Omnitrophota bacterium]